MKTVLSATVRRELIISSNVFEVARKEWDIYLLNPIRDAKLPHNGRARDRRLVTADAGTESEETRLFTACRCAPNQYLSVMVRLAIETAMRQGELQMSSTTEKPHTRTASDANRRTTERM